LQVVPLGLDEVPEGAEFTDPEPPASMPYFAAVGTIEPRKNLGLLLDVWEHFHSRSPEEARPGLCFVGRRGWESPDFFRRLDALKARMSEIREYAALPDRARTRLVRGAKGLLFPSLAEGYGFPPLEALSVGVTPVCAPLPVYAETMGDAAVYADPGDLYQWVGAVESLMTGSATDRRAWTAPSWGDCINKALAMIA
jgi:glycosyltransferase involved in cell wall biosynthesis